MDRFLARGQFPILAERPLEDTPVVNPATAKVYVVEVGAYSDRYIDAIFATRELAEEYVRRRAMVDYGRYLAQPPHIVGQTYRGLSEPDPDRPGWVIVRPDMEHPIGGTVVPKDTFEEWLRGHTWNEYGNVEEYDLWDVLPIAR